VEDASTRDKVVEYRLDIRRLVQERIVEAVEELLAEELRMALGGDVYERTEGRRGYRHGSEVRRVTTANGPCEIRIPRARLTETGGSAREFHSQVLPRYARRAPEIDEAILSCYLAGANTRRIRRALQPLLGEANLSKSAVSRVVVRLKALFAAWRERDVSGEAYSVLFLDGFHLKVRLVRRVVSTPVLAVLGVREDGQKVLVALQLAASEAEANWAQVIGSLQRRGLRAPLLLVVDGHQGLGKALKLWPEVKVQRCTEHKGRNLADHCPRHARPEMRRDYRRIIFAADGLAARAAYDAFLTKWRKLCPAVARSLEEAGLELLTFYEFPKSTWKSLRTTNAVENLNRELRRRTKTQASFSTEEAAVTLLYALVAFDQIKLRRIDGYKALATLVDKQREIAA
jgi:putative transposase